MHTERKSIMSKHTQSRTKAHYVNENKCKFGMDKVRWRYIASRWAQAMVCIIDTLVRACLLNLFVSFLFHHSLIWTNSFFFRRHFLLLLHWVLERCFRTEYLYIFKIVCTLYRFGVFFFFSNCSIRLCSSQRFLYLNASYVYHFVEKYSSKLL